MSQVKTEIQEDKLVVEIPAEYLERAFEIGAASIAFLAGQGAERLIKDMASFKRALKQARCEHDFMELAVDRDRTGDICIKCGKAKN